MLCTVREWQWNCTVFWTATSREVKLHYPVLAYNHQSSFREVSCTCWATLWNAFSQPAAVWYRITNSNRKVKKESQKSSDTLPVVACNLFVSNWDWQGLWHVQERSEIHTWLSLEERVFWRPRRRWEDNVKTNLKETGHEGMEWSNLSQNTDKWRAFVNTVMNLRDAEFHD